MLADECEERDVLVGVMLVRLVGLDDDDADDVVVREERDTKPVLALLADGLDLAATDERPAIARV